MDDVTQPGIHWMQPFVTEIVSLRLTPETEIMNPMVCTTRDGVRNVFRDVQVSVLVLLFSMRKKMCCMEWYFVSKTVLTYSEKNVLVIFLKIT
jgi:hypothetical protein